MPDSSILTRRDALKSASAVGALALAGAGTLVAAEPAKKPLRIGVVSAGIRGRPQPRNGHTWSFCQYLHPTFDFVAMKKHWPQAFDSFQ